MISEGPSVVRLASFVNGSPFKPEDLSDDGVRVVRIRQLVDEEADFDFAQPPQRPVPIDNGDLIFSWSATLAVRIWNRGPALLNQHLFRVDPAPGVDRRWLRYVLEVGIERLKPLMHGSAMTHITQEMLRAVSVRLEPLSAQRAIADYLGVETTRIDALISNKERMIGLLEEARFARLRRAVTTASSTRVRLRYIARIKRGQSPRPIDDPAYFDVNGSHGWVRIEDATRQGMYLRDTRERLSELGKSKSVVVGPGTVLVSIAASVGRTVITDMDCCYHDGWVGLLDLQAIPEFVYYCLSLPEAFGGLGQVGTQTNINSDIVGRVEIPLLDNSAQDTFVQDAERDHAQVIRTQAVLERQIELLREHRQALITAAVTGELEIPGVAA